MGEIYNHIVEKKLAEAAGYTDSTEYFRKELADLSVASLKLYEAVAENFSEPVARRFGVTCLSVLLTYAEATGLELHHDPAFRKLGTRGLFLRGHRRLP